MERGSQSREKIDVLDGMRGYFLVFMMLNHLIFTGGYLLVEINHRQFTFVEDAQASSSCPACWWAWSMAAR